MPLMVVESPTKVKTLARILDDDWHYAVTKGHLFDLPENKMGITDDYEPEWVKLKEDTLETIRGAASSQTDVYLGSDPDREGEAIAWQVANLVLNGAETQRVRFKSLTDSEVHQEINGNGRIDMDLVKAQWARRLLDRLTGYKISPFLINAFDGKKLSAGRVQSAVLARIVDREEEVRSFEAEEFYRLKAYLHPREGSLEEPLQVDLKRIGDVPIGTDEGEELLTDREQAETIREAVDERGLELKDREESVTETNPAFPFDSSELLRRASSWFDWPSSKTMNVAQSLYEKGLITYHRSDSNRLSQSACKKASSFVRKKYGKEYHQWRGGGGGDQEGHEAIRAKNPFLTPDELHSVSRDESTLYAAIWQRYLQSQMVVARWNRMVLQFTIPETEPITQFRSTIRTIREQGFFRCRRPGETPVPERERSASDYQLLKERDVFRVHETECEKSKTQGPSLYTEGTLVAMMKKEGIGRPSTYSSTIDRLHRRQYIKREEKFIEPTRRGRDVCRFLKRAVPAVCDVELTESMEETLDRIAEGREDWKKFVREFDKELDGWLEEGRDVEPEGTAEGFREKIEFETCPRCESTLWLRKGEYGKFVHCEGDDCDFSSNPPAKTYRCPECDRHMIKKKGYRSTVYFCIAEPECNGKRPVGKPSMTLEEFRRNAPSCPECEGKMIRRRGRYGYFWGCESYPECEGTRTMN